MITRARLGLMMGIACFCFGCKGAGGLFKVAGAVAVTAVRVAAVAAATAPHHSSGSSEGGGEHEAVYVAEAPPPPAVLAAPQPPPARCVELAPAPELPGDTIAVRTMACGGRVLVQDADTGLWREHR